MPIATTTIESMEKKLTLQDVVLYIGERFDSLEKRVGFLEHQSGTLQVSIRNLDYKVEDNAKETHLIRQKTDRVELMVYALHKEIDGFHEEMRGVHRVIDGFDARITKLEEHAGFPTETAPA